MAKCKMASHFATPHRHLHITYTSVRKSTKHSRVHIQYTEIGAIGKKIKPLSVQQDILTDL